MEIVYGIFVAAHMLGLAAIVGAFFVQMRRKQDFILGPVLIGAIVQLVSGLALVGLGEAADADFNYAKIGTKLVIALVVLAAAIAAGVVQRRGGRVQPFFHTAGGLAIVNVLVATLWR